jgi:pyruvate dehydrogenase E2 component (dihydrolipoamide acetyltransferase)
MYEIDAFTPIINPSESVILGVGQIAAKPVVIDGEIVIRQMMTLSLGFDHRVIDGAPAARFLQRIKRLLERPIWLVSSSKNL